MTLEGNVVVRQGEREIRANEVHYNPQDSSLSAPGHIDYSDPLVSVTGAGGSYSTAAGADFSRPSSRCASVPHAVPRRT